MTTNLGAMSPILGQNGNYAGSQQAVPTVAGSNTPSIGGSVNPFLPQFPSGSSTPGVSSPINSAPPAGYGPSNLTQAMSGASPGGVQAPSATPASGVSGGGMYNTSATAGLSGSNLSSLLGGLGNSATGETQAQTMNNLVSSLHKAGYSDAVAGALANFLNSGAGFNPQVAQALIASMQPQIAQGQANVMGQFGGAGLGDSSASALGLSNFDSQVQLNEGQILSQLYEQSVQNYMGVLMGGKGNPPQSLFGDINQGINTLSQAGASAGQSAGGLALAGVI